MHVSIHVAAFADQKQWRKQKMLRLINDGGSLVATPAFGIKLFAKSSFCRQTSSTMDFLILKSEIYETESSFPPQDITIYQGLRKNRANRNPKCVPKSFCQSMRKTR